MGRGSTDVAHSGEHPGFGREGRSPTTGRLAIGAGLAAGYWLIETGVHLFVFGAPSFAAALVPEHANELWMRVFTVVLLVIIGLVFPTRLGAGSGAAPNARGLARAVEEAGEGILITDAGGHIEYVNPAFTRLTGWSLDEVRGKTPAVLNSGLATEAYYQALWRTIQEGHVWVGTITDRRRDGTYYPATLTIAPVTDASGTVTHYVGIQHDQSERVALSASLDEAAKGEGLGVVVGGIAHDFNNSLATMTTLAGLASRRAKGNAELEELLASLDLAVDGAAALVRQLLDFARGGGPDAPPARLDLAAFLSRVWPALEPLVPDAISVELVPPAPETVVEADPHGLQHVLANLLINAVAALESRPDGFIRVTVDSAPADGAAGRRFVEVRVEDNGPGIAPERRAQIFEPFFTTKGEGRGTGLGLPTARATLRRFGGDLLLDSGGPGATFVVRLPRSSDEPAVHAS